MPTTSRETLPPRAQQLVHLLETGEPAPGLLADDVLADLNVPAWRFQTKGSDDFVAWVRGELPDGCRIEVGRFVPTADGWLMETVQWVPARGGELMYRNVSFVRSPGGGPIEELVLYCTGDWDAEQRARQAAEAPMYQP